MNTVNLTCIGCPLGCQIEVMTGDEGEILHAPEAPGACPLHEGVEHGPGADLDKRFILLKAHRAQELDTRVKHSPRPVAGKEEVGPCAHMEERLRQFVEVQVEEVLQRIVLHETLTGHLHAESVPAGQVLMVLRPNHGYKYNQKDKETAQSKIPST